MKTTTASPPESSQTASGTSVLLALGANLPAGDPLDGRRLSPPHTLARAVQILREAGFTLRRASRIYRTAPEGGSRDDPDYANAVILAHAPGPAATCLLLAKAIEAMFGRDPTAPRMAARPLDVDLIAADDLIWPDVAGWHLAAAGEGPPGSLVLPHPRFHRRAFVLMPLKEIAPHWRHPVTGETVDAMLHEALALAPAMPRPWPRKADLLRHLLNPRL